MVNVGRLVRLEAKPGKEAEVEQFSKAALRCGLARAPSASSTRLPTRLMAKAADLFASPPQIDKVDVIAAKLS